MIRDQRRNESFERDDDGLDNRQLLPLPPFLAQAGAIEIWTSYPSTTWAGWRRDATSTIYSGCLDQA
jgi:hypothetical protein